MAVGSVQEVMTHDPITVETSATIADAARLMRDHDTGAIIATDSGQIRGIVTDRDIVVRAVADGGDPTQVRIDEVCSGQLVTLNAQDRIQTAVEAMRRHDVRRLPVVDGDRPVGIVSLGDLAMERDEESALADISSGAPNT